MQSDISPPSTPDDSRAVVAHARFSRRAVLTAASGIVLAALITACGTTGKQAATSSTTTPNATATLAHAATPVAPTAKSAELCVVAEFPPGYFLENLEVRSDGSILVTVLNQKELWYIPAPGAGTIVRPMLIHTFDQDRWIWPKPNPTCSTSTPPT
jgi:hypothetical protein